MKSIPIDDLQKTTDLKFAVSAKTAGVTIVTSARNPKTGQYMWYLKRSNLLDRVNQEYISGTLCLPVQMVFYNLEILKSQINSRQ